MEIILASGNPKKALEITKKIPEVEINIYKPDVEETGLTFIENALLKARFSCEKTGLPTIGEDSGICVNALSGAPGIYSARYAGITATSQQNIDKLLNEIRNVPDNKLNAYFYSCVVFIQNPEDPTPIICEGRWHGKIIRKQINRNGFGYDPIFFIPELNLCASELTVEEKNKHSHRGKALDKLRKKLFNK